MNSIRVVGVVLVCAMAILSSGCATGPKPMYMWESFPSQQYHTLLGEGDGPEEQIRTLQAHAEKAAAAGAVLPPGFRAHLGMLQLAVGNAQEARQSWQAEKDVFPESAPYMDQLLSHLDTPTETSAQSESAE